MTSSLPASTDRALEPGSAVSRVLLVAGLLLFTAGFAWIGYHSDATAAIGALAPGVAAATAGTGVLLAWVHHHYGR